MTGKQLQQWRRTRGLSTRDVAGALGISHRTIEKWETNGTIPPIKVPKVEQLLKRETLALRLPVDLYRRLAARAKKKGYESPEAFAADLFNML